MYDMHNIAMDYPTVAWQFGMVCEPSLYDLTIKKASQQPWGIPMLPIFIGQVLGFVLSKPKNRLDGIVDGAVYGVAASALLSLYYKN